MESRRLAHYKRFLSKFDDLEFTGRVTQLIGLTIESQGPAATIGDLCLIESRNARPIYSEVVGFKDKKILLMPLGDFAGVGPGATVTAMGRPLRVGVGPEILGRVLDGLGSPIDGKGPLYTESSYPVHGEVVKPLDRQRISQILPVGVRTIDGLLTCGKGQRIGIFAGSGVGKSTLLGMMARNAEADINVIALVGERGREVREFIERDLGEEGLKRSVVVVATSDQPALVRLKGAQVATAIAEYYRDQGMDVLFMMDSVTRFAIAQREVGLAVGEPPATRGYTPSVFALLPKLLERTGPGKVGTITAFYTVLVEGDDMNEPIADTVRGILDGHIVLARKIAERQHFPAIDSLASVSRLMAEIATTDHLRAAGRLRNLVAVYRDAEDLINIGAYVRGSNSEIDEAIALYPKITRFLQQGTHESSSFPETLASLDLALAK